MKKIIAIMLSAIMLLGVMSVAAFAEDLPNPWELEDFGQKSWTLYLNDKEAPVVDGKIGEGEYALAIEDLSVENDDEDDRIFLVDSPSNLVVDIYMDYDGDYLYVGVVVNDPEVVTEAPHGIDGRIRLDIGGDKNKIHANDMIVIALAPGAVAAGNADEVMSLVEGNVTTYEFTVDKYTIMDKYGFDELDQVYLRYTISDETEASLTNEALWNEMWFGFRSSDAAGLHEPGGAGNNRFPHVVYFVNEAAPEPETEAPATDAPATEAPETEAPAGETEAPTTEAPETEAPAEGGCGASVAAMGVALVAALGTCTAFVSKKR